MNLLKSFSISLLIFCSLVLGGTVFAEETQSTKAVLIADVNIYDAKITSQKGNQINISFELANGVGVQSGVKYSVSLIKETKEGQFLADQFIYPESLSLSPNSRIKRDISYFAPSNLNGEYTILVEVKNERSLPLGLQKAGIASLTSSSNFVEIIPDTCFLSVVDEKNSPKYNLVQGVDIKNTENLKLTCTAVNGTKDALTVTPNYDTFYRTIYGEKVMHEGGDVNPISFNANEKKTFSIILPKAAKPQAYDIKISLKSGEVNSNIIIAHYVLRGASATIQNFSLDKDYYRKNETANITVLWSASADGFFGSRFGSTAISGLTLQVAVQDDKKNECLTPINQAIEEKTKGGEIKLAVPVLENCKNPQATVTIKDASGNILDQKFFSFETVKIDAGSTDKRYGSTKTIMIGFGILIVVGIAWYFINLKKKENETNNQ